MTTRTGKRSAHRSKVRKEAEDRRLLEAWPHPAGTPVLVRGDYGGEDPSVTRSAAWALGDGTPVVLVEGRSGGVHLARVRVRELPPCASYMGCLCAAHARGASADAPCDATE